MKATLFTLLTCFCCHAYSQVVRDPLADMVSLDKKWAAPFPYFPGRVYYKWVFDMNHDGKDELLLADKPTQKERDETAHESEVVPVYQPEEYWFLVYQPIKDGRYLCLGGMNADVSQCFVGYIKELKRYGIVTIENSVVDDPSEPEAKHGVLKDQVIAYTIRRGEVVESKLTPLLDPDEKNPIYDAYLTTSKTANVHLQQITPPSSK